MFGTHQPDSITCADCGKEIKPFHGLYHSYECPARYYKLELSDGNHDTFYDTYKEAMDKGIELNGLNPSLTIKIIRVSMNFETIGGMIQGIEDQSC